MFLAWLSLIKYMEWNVELYMLILAVKASIGRVARFILTVAPVYIAFMVMGVALFYDKPELFGDFFRASATLFALLNGDSILDGEGGWRGGSFFGTHDDGCLPTPPFTIHAVTQCCVCACDCACAVYHELQRHSNTGYVVVSQIYLYCFCILGITVTLNVFVFIIESGYDVSPCSHAHTYLTQTGTKTDLPCGGPLVVLITPLVASLPLSPLQAALNAVYGKDDELTVFVDHMRLKVCCSSYHSHDAHCPVHKHGDTETQRHRDTRTSHWPTSGPAPRVLPMHCCFHRTFCWRRTRMTRMHSTQCLRPWRRWMRSTLMRGAEAEPAPCEAAVVCLVSVPSGCCLL